MADSSLQRSRGRRALSLPVAACVLAAGLVCGAGAAWIITSHEDWIGGFEVAGWHGNRAIGDADADPWTRATIARVGLLALSRDEAVYFSRRRDDDGQVFDPACRYRLRGGALPARWWSVTLYAEDEFLARNQDAAHSVGVGDLARDDGHWQVEVGPTRSNSAWLSTRNAGAFRLMLRLYHPDGRLKEDPADFVPPTVKRLDCGGSA